MVELIRRTLRSDVMTTMTTRLIGLLGGLGEGVNLFLLRENLAPHPYLFRIHDSFRHNSRPCPIFSTLFQVQKRRWRQRDMER